MKFYLHTIYLSILFLSANICEAQMVHFKNELRISLISAYEEYDDLYVRPLYGLAYAFHVQDLNFQTGISVMETSETNEYSFSDPGHFDHTFTTFHLGIEYALFEGRVRQIQGLNYMYMYDVQNVYKPDRYYEEYRSYGGLEATLGLDIHPWDRFSFTALMAYRILKDSKYDHWKATYVPVRSFTFSFNF